MTGVADARFVYSEPEALFRVGPLGGAGDSANGEMLTGRWMLDDSGRSSRGSLFVLVDDVFGYAAMARMPEGRWAVTTELSLDFGADPRLDGRAIVASAELVNADAAGGLGQGTIRDADGRVLALGAARVRYSDNLPAQLGELTAKVPAHFDREGLADGSVEQILGATLDGMTMLLPASPLLANSIGPTHGGVLACASEMLAVSVARRTNPAFATTSVHITFVRPGASHTPVTLSADVKHGGRTLQVIEITSRNPDGKAFTLATVICQVASAA